MIAGKQTKLVDLRELMPSLLLQPANDPSAELVIESMASGTLVDPVLAYPVSRYPAQQIVTDKRLVQKKRASNVLIADPVVLSEKKFLYRTQLNTDENNAFFYDSNAETDFDMILTAASQQLCRAVFYKQLGYSLDSQFKLKDFALTMMMEFSIDDDIIIDISLQNLSQPALNISHKLYVKLWLHQKGKTFAIGSAQWSI